MLFVEGSGVTVNWSDLDLETALKISEYAEIRKAIQDKLEKMSEQDQKNKQQQTKGAR